MNKNYYAVIGCYDNGMYYGRIVEKWEGLEFFIGATQDFTCAAVQQYLHGHGVPYNNITVK